VGGAAIFSGQAPVDSEAAFAALSNFSSQLRVQVETNLLLRSGGVLVIMAISSGLLGWLLAGRLLRPLREVTGAARSLSAANLHERLRLDGPRDELRELGDTFDEMLERLDAAFASQRRFVANASHELRTPLAIMRAQVDVALAEPDVTRAELLATAAVVRGAVDRTECLLESLLTLARSDRGLDVAESVDLAQVATAALDQARVELAERGLEVRTDLQPARVRGDRGLLERMVANLLENAATYNRPEGWVELSTANGSDRARLRVASSGKHVPADKVASLFEPFRRLQQERTVSGRGAGLGLSIVRSVARAHGGDVLAAALVNGGLTVEADLPAAN
jgi:signal transduction histidine kinase